MQSVSSKYSQTTSVHLQHTGQRQRGDSRAALCRSTAAQSKPWQRRRPSSVLCLHRRRKSSGRVCRCCAAAATRSLGSQRSHLGSDDDDDDNTHTRTDSLKDGTVLQTHSTCFCVWVWVRVCACVCVSPCPPGYMQRKALPSSSACTRPAGVSSPPHFSTSSRDGPSLRVSERWYLGQRPVRERQKQTNKQKKKEPQLVLLYLPPRWRSWAARGGDMSAAPSC